MGFFSSYSADRLRSCFRIIQEGVEVRRHIDLLKWLQGEVQQYLPHEIMLAAWGDFNSGSIRHDIVSPLPGVRTAYFEPGDLSPWLRALYQHWVAQGRIPCSSNIDALQIDTSPQYLLGQPLREMRSFLLHGIRDRRGRDDCIYVIFSSQAKFDDSAPDTMEILLPYLDTALRKVTPFPHHPAGHVDPPQSEEADHGLSEREAEIMNWVRRGKTNAEIGHILSISAFTVKNHLHHIFQKLDVYNRIQAVSKMERSFSHG